MDFLPMPIENALMMCDITSWIDLAYGVSKHGRLHRFQWSDDPSGYEVERILRERGVHAYGRMCQWYEEPDSDGKKRRHMRRWCWVNGKQADWGERNLLRAGVSLESTAVNPANWLDFGKGAYPATWTEGKTVRPTLLERVSDMFAGLTR